MSDRPGIGQCNKSDTQPRPLKDIDMQPMTGTTIQTTAPPPTDDTGTTIQTARARTQGGTVHDIGLDVTIGGQQE